MSASKNKIQQIDQLSGQLQSLLARNHQMIHGLFEQAQYITTCLNTDASTDPLTTHITPTNTWLDAQDQITDLQTENAHLKQTLALVMTKFRELESKHHQDKHDLRKELERQLAEERQAQDQLRSEYAALQQRFLHMLKVMQHAASAEEDRDQAILMESLIKENEGLKEMLGISQGE